MIRVRLLNPYRRAGGPHYRQGEVAGFPDRQAKDLIRRGWAERVMAENPTPPTPRPQPEPERRAVDEPPEDKMLRRPGKSK